jgi:hypothetical protein
MMCSSLIKEHITWDIVSVADLAIPSKLFLIHGPIMMIIGHSVVQPGLMVHFTEDNKLV